MAKTLVTAASGPENGVSLDQMTIPVFTPIRCQIPTAVHHGKKTVAVCTPPLVPAGTKVTLYDTDKRQHALAVAVAVAKVHKGKATFTFVLAKKRQYRFPMWAVTSPSPHYSSTRRRQDKVRAI